jgi:hypothetical protein
MTAMRAMRGLISLSNSTHLLPNDASTLVNPVALPPSHARGEAAVRCGAVSGRELEMLRTLDAPWPNRRPRPTPDTTAKAESTASPLPEREDRMLAAESEHMRRKLALHIMRRVNDGESDPVRLADSAILSVLWQSRS